MWRKVYKGVFVDRPFVDYGDCDLIGAHIAVNRENANIGRTRGLEYYVYDDSGRAVAIGDVSVSEKFFANLKYVFKLNKKKVVGYRSTSPNYATFKLGLTYDRDGNQIVDEGYYSDAIDRVMHSDIPNGAKRERVAAIEEVREKARREVSGKSSNEELDEMFESSEKSTGQETDKGKGGAKK